MADVLDLTRFRDSTKLMASPAALRDRAMQDGYVWLRGFLSLSKLIALRRRVIESCTQLGWVAPGDQSQGVRARAALNLGASDDPRYLQFLVDVMPSSEFAALGDDQAIRETVSALCDAPVARRHADICRVYSPDTNAFSTRPHQDQHYLGGTDPGWTVWIPLVDCPLSMGPLAVLRGSQRHGLRPHRKDGIVQYIPDTALAGEWESGDLSVGDAIIFHGCTVHRALPNRNAGYLRLSVDYRYLSG